MSNTSPQQAIAHTTGDGIEEYDNHLPNWWLATFYGAIIFAIGYWFAYHVYFAVPLPPADTLRVLDEIRIANPPIVATSDALVAMSKDAAKVADGKQVFATNCVACHGPAGGGIVGPNLTDEFWLHGGAPDQIFNTVRDGVPTKGMPTWGPTLGGDRVKAAVAYVLTLRNTNVPGGKAPQGEKFASAQ